jgi:galactose-1-phosphate uridylyltransferase
MGDMQAVSEVSIMQLDDILAELPAEERVAFEKVFHVSVSSGDLVPPPEMRGWIEQRFGSEDLVRHQKIIKVTNTVTLEGVLFNWLRSSRPIWHENVDLDQELAKAGGEPFDDPYKMTPEDVFGRVEGEHCVTASNIAKFDGFHGVIIFKEAHPLRWDREHIHDYLNTAERWAALAHRSDPTAKYYFFLWNCLWRAGASLLHGHAQMLLGRDLHYAAVEYQRRVALQFEATHRGNYFEALYVAHENVGAGFERDGVRVMANLAPVKEHEVILMADEMTDQLKDRIYEALACLRDQVGVRSFNLVLYRPPLAPSDESWEGFPVMVRIVDRGDPTMRTNDFGGMELYAASVLASDPLKLAQTLREAMPE